MAKKMLLIVQIYLQNKVDKKINKSNEVIVYVEKNKLKYTKL